VKNEMNIINFFKKLIFKLTQLRRITKQLIMILADSFLIVCVLLSSFSLRLGYLYWPKEEIVWIIFGAPLLAIPIFISFKLYLSVVRYIGSSALWSIIQAVSLYAVAWGLINYMASIGGIPNINGIPRSVILINWMLTILVISGIRLMARWLFTDEQNNSDKSIVNVLIYGAGEAGRQLSRALQLSKEYHQIAYIDDGLSKERASINNIPVYAYGDIQKLIEDHKVSEVLLALPSISRKKRNQIIEKLSPLPVHVRSLPSVSELAGGKVKVDDLLEVNLRDLLGRDSVKPNKDLLKINITDKVVLVTGAGGSIGSELCRQIVKLKPKKIILYELSESSLYQIEQELAQLSLYHVEVFAILGSVKDKLRIRNVFNFFKVETVYHAAAYKHVPLVEYNQSEGVLNNSIGTLNVAKAAISAGIETFVLISTDKAVRPTNTMGTTKRVAELILQALSQSSSITCFTMVRFGNVLDSSGSVIPKFKKQIKSGGPVTVTDKNIVRYFMTIPEAVELVIQAGAMGKGGDVFVLEMGQPILIYDLAVKMIQLSGLQVIDKNNLEGDIEIQYTGLRPGEKLYEELLVGENVSQTEHKLIMTANEKMIDWDKLEPILIKLENAALNSDQLKIRNLLKELVPEFKPETKISDLLYDKDAK
jgi:FlaA1/EpsC-like NDP-sugar epimerase